ncbi:MAG: hypothetical protein F8N39_19460 [Clostridiaceae bacterium]|nr:hypothetical protein [Clostridiaceae bacterium]
MYISLSIEELEGILKEAKNNHDIKSMTDEIIIEFQHSEEEFDAYISQVTNTPDCELQTLYHKRYDFLNIGDIDPFTLETIKKS